MSNEAKYQGHTPGGRIADECDIAKSIIGAIDDFDRECDAQESTDSVDAWDHLRTCQASLQVFVDYTPPLLAENKRLREALEDCRTYITDPEPTGENMNILAIIGYALTEEPTKSA